MTSASSEYDRLIRPIEQHMFRSVWRVVQHEEDARDAFQDALATIWKRIDRVRGHNNPRALILRICVDAARDVVRKRSRTDQRTRPLESLGALAESDKDALEKLNDEEQRIQISDAVAQLSEQQAAAVSMRYLLDLPYSDIADALGCAEATTRNHVHRGVQRLRSLVGHLNPTPNTERTR